MFKTTNRAVKSAAMLAMALSISGCSSKNTAQPQVPNLELTDEVALSLPEIANAINQELSKVTDKPIVIASVCGTEDDPQNYQQQCAELEQSGIVLCYCNSEMAKLCAAILRQLP